MLFKTMFFPFHFARFRCKPPNCMTMHCSVPVEMDRAVQNGRGARPCSCTALAVLPSPSPAETFPPGTHSGPMASTPQDTPPAAFPVPHASADSEELITG